ncbi:hypothetical protein BS17DRAFT_767554 [Gyrodon lividus]|nr:hypothetical protein BS17DRAFT_767554 [Gyrodon lividus]
MADPSNEVCPDFASDFYQTIWEALMVNAMDEQQCTEACRMQVREAQHLIDDNKAEKEQTDSENKKPKMNDFNDDIKRAAGMQQKAAVPPWKTPLASQRTTFNISKINDTLMNTFNEEVMDQRCDDVLCKASLPLSLFHQQGNELRTPITHALMTGAKVTFTIPKLSPTQQGQSSTNRTISLAAQANPAILPVPSAWAASYTTSKHAPPAPYGMVATPMGGSSTRKAPSCCRNKCHGADIPVSLMTYNTVLAVESQ